MKCHRLAGGSVRDCECRLPNGSGWLPCPSEARGVLRRSAPSYSGDICAECGSPSMVRTGTCLTCQNCGSSSGGCS